jgi:hypothetical protein
MLNSLLHLLGFHVDGAAHIVDWTLAFHGLPVGWFVLLALVLGAAVFWSYRTESVSTFRRAILFTLRTVFLLLILLLLVRPVLAVTVEGTIRRSLVVLLDASGSMNIRDARTEPADLKRAAIAQGLMDPAKGLEQPLKSTDALKHIARIDLLKDALKNPKLKLLQRLGKEYDLRPYTFGQELHPLAAATGASANAADQPAKADSEAVPAWVDQLGAKAPVTAGGDAVRKVIADLSGQPLAGIVIASDGASNTGLPMAAAADLARQNGVPLYVYGVGIAAPRDIVVSNIFAPDTVFAEDELPVTVRVRSQGLAGQTATLNVQLGDQTVHQVLTLVDGEQMVPLKLTTKKIAPKKELDLDLKASIDPRDDEAVKNNNATSQHLRVIDGKIKVLYVEQSPRWEFRYLQTLLMRDRRIEVKFVLLEGDPGIAKDDKSPFLAKFPETAKDLADFDLLMIGDVDPHAFSSAQMDMIGEFVSKLGGGMLMIAGRRHGPAAYAKTPIEKMLPVETDSGPGLISAGRSGDESTDKPLKLELTAAGAQSTMMRLTDKEEQNGAKWAALPALYWDARVARSKPAAQVLLVDADPAKASRFGKMPVIALQQYGLGQVLYIGTDNTWRWRKNDGESLYTKFWGQIVQRLSLPRLLGAGSKRTQLTADRQNYVAFDKVTIYARLYNESFQPVNEPNVKGFYQVAGQAEQAVQLRAIAEQPGMYRAEFIAPQAGDYTFWLERDPKAKLAFSVGEPKLELAETAMQEAALKEMAAASGGAFFREEDLNKLPEQIQKEAKGVRSTTEIELGFSPLYFLLLMGVVTAEWIVRKLSQLK